MGYLTQAFLQILVLSWHKTDFCKAITINLCLLLFRNAHTAGAQKAEIDVGAYRDGPQDGHTYDLQ